MIERLEELSPRLTRDEGQVSVKNLLSILRDRKRIVLTWGGISWLLAAVLAFTLSNVYTSTASFIPPGAGAQSSTAAMMGQLASMSGLGGMLAGKSQGDLYVGFLKSQTIAHDLVSRFDLLHYYHVKKESQAEKRLASESAFDLGSKDPIVRISVTDKSPEQARDLANGYLEALQRTSAELAVTESSQRRQFFEQRLAKEKNELADAEVALKQSEEKTGLVAPAGQTAVNIQALAQIQAQITQRQADLAGLRKYYAEESPEVLRVQEEIGSLQQQADRLANGQGKERFGRFSTSQVPGLELEYIRRAREVKYHEALFEIISRQYEAARLDEAKDAPLQVLDRPVVPDTKSGPHRTLIMVLGLLIGSLCGAAYVLFRAS